MFKLALFILISLLYWNDKVRGDAGGSGVGSPSGQGQDPSQPFWAARGRRSGQNQNGDSAMSPFGDVENSEMEPMKLWPWGYKYQDMDHWHPKSHPMDTLKRPRTNQLSAIDDPAIFYSWYTLRKKNGNSKVDPEAPFWAARG